MQKNKNGLGHNSIFVGDATVHKALTKIFNETKQPLVKAMDILRDLMNKTFKEYSSGFKCLTEEEEKWNNNAEHHNKWVISNDPDPTNHKKLLLKTYKQKKLSAEDKYELKNKIANKLWSIFELVSDAEATARVYEEEDNFSDWVDSERHKDDKKN